MAYFEENYQNVVVINVSKCDGFGKLDERALREHRLHFDTKGIMLFHNFPKQPCSEDYCGYKLLISKEKKILLPSRYKNYTKTLSFLVKEGTVDYLVLPLQLHKICIRVFNMNGILSVHLNPSTHNLYGNTAYMHKYIELRNSDLGFCRLYTESISIEIEIQIFKQTYLKKYYPDALVIVEYERLTSIHFLLPRLQLKHDGGDNEDLSVKTKSKLWSSVEDILIPTQNLMTYELCPYNTPFHVILQLAENYQFIISFKFNVSQTTRRSLSLCTEFFFPWL